MADDGQAPFDPPAYAAVYQHLLRHRRALTLWVGAQLEPRKSVYDLDVAARELVPTIDAASAIVAQLEYALIYRQYLRGLVVSNMTAGVQAYLKRTASIMLQLPPASWQSKSA